MPEQLMIPLLEIKQWLPTWNRAEWTEKLPEPPRSFYIGSIKIETLRRISTVRRRDLALRKAGSEQAGTQRGHEPERSKKIRRYIDYGYPVSSQAGIDPEQHSELIHPGWIPTTIIANVLKTEENRFHKGQERQIKREHVVSVTTDNSTLKLSIPSELLREESTLQENDIEPIEIIDGQHRLLALEFDENLPSEYQIPVVFFHGLTPAWQAYLFWVINVEPKRINTSLAFDLYPELRNQSWLERGEWLKVYQEHRAQELTEILWRHPSSPWEGRIELHGKRIPGHVSNAAFIRSLMASFIRKGYEEDKERIGGLFGSIDREGKNYALPWRRSQQAAFLIHMWKALKDAVDRSEAPWVLACAGDSIEKRLAFDGPDTLLGSDQGVRGILFIFNALLVVNYQSLELANWETDDATDETSDSEVTEQLEQIQGLQKLNEFLQSACDTIINNFDWRFSGAPGLSSEESQYQGAYKGSSGYSLIQRNIMRCLLRAEDQGIAQIARDAAQTLKWIELLDGTE